MVMSALLMLPLLAFAGFAVDIGYWYTHANRMQRAADAAAPGRCGVDAQRQSGRDGHPGDGEGQRLR